MNFQASNSNVLTIAEYEANASLKDEFAGEKGKLITHVDMKIKDVGMAYIQDSFKIEYARYLEFKPNVDKMNIENISVEKKRSFPTVGNIVLIKYLLCYF